MVANLIAAGLVVSLLRQAAEFQIFPPTTRMALLFRRDSMALLAWLPDTMVRYPTRPGR